MTAMQSALTFPQPLAEKYRPRHIADFIGLEKPRKVLGAFVRRPMPSAFLFVGPPGVGKTTMALALAREIRAELHHIPSQSCNVEAVQTVCASCERYPYEFFGPDAGPRAFHLILVDEADRMSPAAQLALLSKLDSTAFPRQTVFVFTANQSDGLDSRFLSRCKVLEFSSYGMRADLAALLRRVWSAEGGNGNAPDFERLAKETTNNVRDALMRLEVELLASE